MSLVLDGTAGVTGPATKVIVGTTTNDSATAGYVGEYVEGVLAAGSATALTTDTPKTLVSISLTAGDWDVTGMVGVQPNPSAVYSYALASVSPTTNTQNTTGTNLVSHTQYPAGTLSTQSTDPRIALPMVRVSLASTTTYYLICQAGFTVSSCLGYGRISARRVR
jgi:hypothetical protein